MFLSDQGPLQDQTQGPNVQNVRLYFLYRQYINLFMFFCDEGPTLETLDFTFYIGSISTSLYFDLHIKHSLRSTLHFMFLSDEEGRTFETIDFAFYIGSTSTFLSLYLYFAAHNV